MNTPVSRRTKRKPQEVELAIVDGMVSFRLTCTWRRFAAALAVVAGAIWWFITNVLPHINVIIC